MIEVNDAYERYREHLRTLGVSEADIAEEVTYQKRLDKMCDDLICMVCGGSMTRKLDPRHSGAPPGTRVYFNYRCPSKCQGSMTDRLETLPENLN